MRGIGHGQTIELYLIPEVEQRIAQELGLRRTGRHELDVPGASSDVDLMFQLIGMIDQRGC